MENRKDELISNALEEAFNTKQIAGACVLVLDKGKKDYYNQIGYSNIENNKEISRDSIFRLYSMTKPVTAAATMILMERGLIDLMDPVKHYIPSFDGQSVFEDGELVPVNRDINIKELLNFKNF